MNKKKQDAPNDYKGLPQLLHGVRWMQHFMAILAEVLILVSFAMSGADIGQGGAMAGVGWLKTAWAYMFAAGVDVCFVLSWVRVRQYALARRWWAFGWYTLLAIGMSLIVWQPVMIQLLQQAKAISFDNALQQLHIDIVFLVNARSIVAVALGAILAMTNVETAMSEGAQATTQSKRRVVFFDKLLDKVAPVSSPTVTVQPALTWQADALQSVAVSQPTNDTSDNDTGKRQTTSDKRQRILEYRQRHPNATRQEIATALGISKRTVERHDATTTEQQRLRVVH